MKRNSLTNVFVCIILMMAIFVFIPTTASAESHGYWTYTANSDGTTATITGYTASIGSSETLTIPDVVGSPELTVTAVSDAARLGEAKGIVIGENLTAISIESIRKRDDYSEYNLETITVNASNTKYRADSNVLFEKDSNGDQTKLVCYPAAKSLTSYTVPTSATLTSIGEYAFYGADVQSITIPDEITEIGVSAFDNSSIMYAEFGTGITSFTNKQFTVADDSSLNIVLNGDVTSITRELISASSSNQSIYIHAEKNSPAHVFAVNEGYCFLDIDDNSIVDTYYVVDQQTNALVGYYGDSTVLTIPATVERVHADFIKSTGKSATEITIPASVTTIDNEVIIGLTELTTFAVSGGANFAAVDGVLVDDAATPTTIYAYPQKKAGNTYATAATVTTIEDYAFYSNDNVTTLTLDTAVANIGIYAFADSNIATVTMNSTTPDMVISEGAFMNTQIASVTIPNVVKTIGVNAFADNKNLDTINFGTGVAFVGPYAFGGCDDLESINLPDSLQFLDEHAFADTNSSLTFDLPSGTWVSSADGAQLSTTTNIPVYTVSGDETTYNSYALIDSSVYNSGFVYDPTINKVVKYVGGSTDVTVQTSFGSETATVIADGAFSGSIIEELTVPSDFTLIPDDMASGSMVDTVILQGTAEIGEGAFQGCPLAAVTLPDSLKFVDRNAFRVYEVGSITSISFPSVSNWYNNFGESVTEINDFDNDNYYYIDNYAHSVDYNLSAGTDNDTLNPAMFVKNDGKIYLRNAWDDDVIFEGWYTDSGYTSGNEVYYIDGDSFTENGTLNIYAKFVSRPADTYAITYYLYGGNNNIENPFYYSNSCDDFDLKDAYKEGSIFDGWETDSGAAITTITSSTGNINVHAQWTNSYDINYYDLYDGLNNPDNPTQYNANVASPITLKDATRSGYAFAGWYNSRSDSATKITQIDTSSDYDINLFAQWYTEYNIDYNLDGGTNNSSNPAKFNEGMTDITLANPTKDGMTFAGWYETDDFSGTKVTVIDVDTASDVTLYAKWSDGATTYSITYVLNDGTNNASNPTSYTASTETITLAAATRTDYIFEGWYTDSGFADGTKITQIVKGSTGDKTLYAKWTAVAAGTYTITYELYGGANNASNPSSFTETTETITLADPTKTGYTFGGWYTDSAFTEANKITQIVKGTANNVYVYAKWTADTTYTITYNLNGGTNSASNPSTFTATTETITLASPTKSGYTFDGWYTDSTFTAANKITQIVKGTNSNVVLYAKWVGSYTLTYNSNGGSGSASVTKAAGTTFNLYNGSEFTRSGYVLDGWASSSSATKPDYLLGALYTMPQADKTLYAVWVADSDGDGISDADETAVGTDPNDDDDKPNTATIKGKVLDASGNPIVGAIVILNSDPVTTTTNASGIYEFDGVSLSPHTLTITDGGVTLGTYTLNFTEGSTNSYSVSDSGSTDSVGVININVTGESLTIEVDIEQNAAGEWQVSDVDLNDSDGNDLPATATNNYLLLIISLVIIVGAAIGVTLLIKKMRNSN